MLQSLFLLPLAATSEVLVFLLLYVLTPLNGKQAALIVALLSTGAVVVYSLSDWPGADVLSLYVAVLALTAYLLGIVSNAREHQQANGRWFHWGPAIIIIFFVVLLALDGVLVVISSQGLPAPVAEFLLPESTAHRQARSVFPGKRRPVQRIPATGGTSGAAWLAGEQGLVACPGCRSTGCVPGSGVGSRWSPVAVCAGERSFSAAF
jgi:hypothetical protein